MSMSVNRYTHMYVHTHLQAKGTNPPPLLVHRSIDVQHIYLIWRIFLNLLHAHICIEEMQETTVYMLGMSKV